ncbi:MAG: hypothetical protein ACM3SP_05045 [Chloroflexota bacterium]
MKDISAKTTEENTPSTAASGFGKVLSSIQGLQQRLNDFSLEEVSQTEDKAQTLIEKLCSLQARFALVEKLRAIITDANQVIEAIPVSNFDVIAPDSLDNHPQLRAIVQADKLIRMYRTLQAARASADAVGFDLDAPRLRQSAAANPAGDDTVQARTISASERNSGIESSAQSELAAPVHGNNTVAAGDRFLAPDLTGNLGAPSAPVVNSDQTGAIQSTAIYDFADLKLDDFAPPAPHREPVGPQSVIRLGTMSAHPQKEQDAPSGGTFDQRLLNDLIDTYGEFAILNTPSEANEPRSQFSVPVPAPQDSIDQGPAVSSVALVPVSADADAFLALPPPAQDETQQDIAREASFPSIKKHGEFDRQLKSIIKDYGEYDLYSHAKPSKFNKMAAIAAFVVLGLVLAGFYLFNTPPRTPATPQSIVPMQATSDLPSNSAPDVPKQKNP